MTGRDLARDLLSAVAGLSVAAVVEGVGWLCSVSWAPALLPAVGFLFATAAAIQLWVLPNFGDEPASQPEPPLDADDDWFGDLGAHVHHERAITAHAHTRRLP